MQPGRPSPASIKRANFPTTFAYQTARAKLLGFDSYNDERRFKRALATDRRLREFGVWFRSATGLDTRRRLQTLTTAELITLRQFNRNAYQAWRQKWPRDFVGPFANTLRMTGIRRTTDYREAASYEEGDEWEHFQDWAYAHEPTRALPRERRDIYEYAQVIDRGETNRLLEQYS